VTILETAVFQGPNVWSASHPKLIALRVEADIRASGETLLHRGLRRLGTIYSPDETWAGLLGKIAASLQQSAGSTCSFSTAVLSDKGRIAEVAFEYEHQGMGMAAGQASVRIMKSILEKEEPNLSHEIRLLQALAEYEGLDQLSNYLVGEAIRRGIPWLTQSTGPLLILGYGSRQKRILRSTTDGTSLLGSKMAGNKFTTKLLLQSMGIPVPEGRCIRDLEDLADALEMTGYPAVIKPATGSKGRGVSAGVTGYREAIRAFHAAKPISRKGGVVVEKFVAGSDYRLLVIGFKFIAATKRIPPVVTGDGQVPIKALIHRLNRDPRRGPGHSKPLTDLEVDENMLYLLGKQGLTPDSILPEGQSLTLRAIANTSVGGTTEDVTDLVHPDNAFLAERIAKIIGLNICGLDFISPDVSIPYHANNGSIIEVNSGPGIRLHMEPSVGQPRNVAATVLDMLFPPDVPSGVPIIVVTSTSDQRGCCDLIAGLGERMGYCMGYATAKGIFIGGIPVSRESASGYKASHLLLRDPTVDAVVLDYPASEVLARGLVFQYCDIGIVTDLGDRPTQDSIRAATVIASCVSSSGFAILNADVDPIYDMHQTVAGNVVYITANPGNPRVIKHSQSGGLVITLEDGHIFVRRDHTAKEVSAIPDHVSPAATLGLLSFVAVGSVWNADFVVIKDTIERFLQIHD